MKKITVLATLIASLVGFSALAEDSYIYWLVDSSTDNFTWDYADLFALSASGESTWIAGYDASASPTQKFDTRMETVVTPYTGEGWSYYVELVNTASSTTDAIATTRIPQTYADLAASGAIRAQSDPRAISPVTFNSFQAVPEPSTGLMLLVGLALVGLKRKRA